MKKRVLIIDEEVAIMPESRQVIRDQESVLDIAKTVEEAKMLLSLRDYEYIIVGPKSGDPSGEKEEGATERFWEGQSVRGVIQLTGFDDARGVEDALSIGVAYYYAKWVSTKIIREVLKKVFDAEACTAGGRI